MRKVEVIQYQEKWKANFLNVEEELRRIFPDPTIIFHHIGSTSVEGLTAKPIIDFLIEVPSLKLIDQQEAALETICFIAKGENGIKNRRFFYRNVKGARESHLHFFESGDSNLTRHLAFRDYLRNHSEEAKAYGEIKVNLARKFPNDMDSYIEGKDQFVKALERRALQWLENY
ncbi:GrpB family protein [Bacillus sp. 2205SS5-2]|uniref:GrpB family protein n=1 Tax=Bacillus sp. 2205SS5-2 TaxID=3109031 RepID=UPI003005AE06